MEYSSHNFSAIGTDWTIDLPSNLSAAEQSSLVEKLKDRLELFDFTYSRFRADSIITLWSKKAGQYPLPDDAGPLLALYEKVYSLTDGLVNPLIGKTIASAGYDANYSLRASSVLEETPSWEDVLSIDKDSITFKKPAILDLGAAGKGYAIDLLSDILTEHGLESFMINAGGDIFRKEETDSVVRVGLEDPQDSSKVIGVASLHNGSLCASAGNRRAWPGFHHIINPKTKKSPQDIIAVWVSAETAALADILATALFFCPPEKLKTTYDFEYVIIGKDRSVKYSTNFKGELFLK
ncbi:MAG: FAD:protein FMN transferase [Patescibacteria group bacterium]|nr:MAG: FAD:protein FMN transferase [Patescibacteria group bacterium]